MKQDKKTIRCAFRKPPCILVRVSPDGFVVEDQVVDELTGQLVHVRLIRKRFEEKVLACDSSDGERSREGRVCAHCLHTDCRPFLRIHLSSEGITYVIDLAITAANNYFLLEDQAEARGENIRDWLLSLHVVNRGHWGEVCFEKR